ncbi:ABC transporter ATP-binding protein [Caproicibacter fermentans]|uniref:ABC transporter ATP-binding protein n=1 Tax=Caproicibacter fermentans TaxID=2576756 RepID=A0A7G8TC60_9FIRM|nr:ABC transporter ATP-binding protein [Caproicibacter fermentans]QNK41201.1 ABC transporter ATP-binding protein [Caproicibacter fermentans]
MNVSMKSKKLKNFSEFLQTILYCIRLSWDASKYYTIIRIGLQILSPFLLILTSFLGKYLIDFLTGAQMRSAKVQYRALFFLFTCILAVSLIQVLSTKITQYAQSMHDNILNERIALMIMDRSLTADLEYFDNPDYHDKLLAATRDSSTIVHLLWNAISCVSAFVSFVSTFVILCGADFYYGIILSFASIPSAIAAAKYTKSLYQLSIEQLNGERKKSYFQSIAVDKHYAQDLRLFNAGPLLKNKYQRIWQELFTKQKRVNRKRTVFTALLDCVPEILSVAIGMDIAFKIVKGFATVGDYSLYTGLISQLLAAISTLSLSVMQIYDGRLRIANLRTLEKFESHINNTGTKALDTVNSIEFEHVSFTYPGTQTKVLDDLSFLLSHNEKVALVGLNGSGKSTLIKLLLRMYEPSCGVIKINGIDIREYSLSSLRTNFSVYFQDMNNYCFTLQENITIADSSQQLDEIHILSALQSSCCDDIIQKASKGMSTSITRVFDPDGIELSGGQHQKLALARTLFRRCTALILDEPSSNLDPKAEHDIFESLQALTDGKMTIFTSHRLSNISLADRIIVLENGKVIEDGTQEQLLKNKCRYAELFQYQREKYQIKQK